MSRSIAIVGAPTSIGIRTYDSGEPRQLDRAPEVLREFGLVQRLSASDLGDVIPPAYRDYVRPPGRVRNEAEGGAYCLTLEERVEEATRNSRRDDRSDDIFATVRARAESLCIFYPNGVHSCASAAPSDFTASCCISHMWTAVGTLRRCPN